eukprot:2735063-Pleurochrysis_carterae.AAC.1
MPLPKGRLYELCAAVRNRELEKKWRIRALSHSPPGRASGFHVLPQKNMPHWLEYDHVVTRLSEAQPDCWH